MSNEHEPADAPDALAVSSEEMTLREVRRLLAEVAEERRQLRAENARLIAEIETLNYNLQDEARESTAWCKLAKEAVEERDALRAMEAALPMLIEIACDLQRRICANYRNCPWTRESWPAGVPAPDPAEVLAKWRKEVSSDD